MTETKRLYYEDVYKKEFTAKVLECREAKKGFHIILDESAFYPEGGGQPSDTGYLNDVKVKEVHEKDGELLQEILRLIILLIHQQRQPYLPLLRSLSAGYHQEPAHSGRTRRRSHHFHQSWNEDLWNIHKSQAVEHLPQ